MDYINDLEQLVLFLEQTHPDLYRNITKDEFYFAVNDIKRKVLTKEQFRLELMKLVAKIKDPHTFINVPEVNIPFKIKTIGDNFYITDDFVNLESRFVGKRIISVNGFPINECLNKINLYISFDNDARKKTCYCDLLSNLFFLKLIDANKFIEFDLLDEKDNSIVKINIDEESKKPIIKKDEKLSIEYDGYSKIFYIKYGTCMDTKEKSNVEFIHQTVDELYNNDVQKVIVDLKENNGGNLSYVMPLIETLKEFPNVDVLVDGGTFSSAFVAAVRLKNNGANLIGTEMGMASNHFGDCLKCTLPSGIVVYCSSKEYFMQDGKLYGLSDETNLGQLTDVVYGSDKDGKPLHYQIPTKQLHSRKPYILDRYLSFSSFEEYKIYKDNLTKELISLDARDNKKIWKLSIFKRCFILDYLSNFRYTNLK